MRRPPLIIIGMHRSGTTLVVELLRKLGFFAGSRLEQNLEPPFFITRNEWLMRRLGGSWDNPSPAKTLRLVPEYRDKAVEIMQREVKSFGFRAYTGGLQIDGPWGWKDPRNTFTAVVWCKVFPGASVLHVIRNGIDVARSLQTREQKALTSGTHRLLSPRPLTSRIANAIRRFERQKINSARCLILEEGFRLWEEYVQEADEFLESYDGNKLSIRYEDLLRNPATHLSRLASFAGLTSDVLSCEAASEGIMAGRAFAFRSEGLADNFTKTAMNSSFMRKHGYGSIAEGGPE